MELAESLADDNVLAAYFFTAELLLVRDERNLIWSTSYLQT